MKPAGLKEIERAKTDGRWDAAYDSASKATVPSDFQSALDSNARAKDFFGTLDSRNRYADLFRLQPAKQAETRAKRISQFVQMMASHDNDRQSVVEGTSVSVGVDLGGHRLQTNNHTTQQC